MSEAIYVTGIGIVSPAGCGVEPGWRGLAAGDRFVAEATDPEITGGGVAPAGAVPGFAPPAGLQAADRVCQLAVAAGDEALAQADWLGHDHPPVDSARGFVSFGTSKGGVLTFARLARILPISSEKSYKTPLRLKSLYPQNTPIDSNRGSITSIGNYNLEDLNGGINLLYLVYSVSPDAPARHLADRFGVTGGAHATVAACATGTLAVIRAVQHLRDGRADAAIAGSSDASLHPLWFAAFRQMGVLAPVDAVRGAAWACRPFDRQRRGFAIGEGAAVLVLETAASVRRRGVRPLARIRGCAAGTDPAGLAQLSPDGTPLARTIRRACADAGISPADLTAIQAHGTGTVTNDLVEAAAIRAACSDRAAEVPAVSFKGALGHLLGAAGAVELALSVRAVADRLLPPNATLTEPDPLLGPLYLPTQPTRIGPGPILKTSLAFGGHVAAVILDAP
ncbi:MAG: beta-ketoacyl-[acyl-carrier-protein] synthase family protein [Planctomycetes bacterium]|nr:beta-ketoacyl-[acyl-carrier-protein] synthase family protein [Planctomycetota bacterium]